MDRIDALRYLLLVAEVGSFSAVARQPAVATSTVSLAVDQMDAELGVKLMTRSTRRLIFTHEGDALLTDARRIVGEWDAAMAGLREDGPLAGPIRVTATNDCGRGCWCAGQGASVPRRTIGTARADRNIPKIWRRITA